ncbi:hypothetical protein SS50377_21430 [Spironucleus salmonicida]|uniref:Uncharacterized protein n=1 Tax=Spironucleus salmonicida TaxID=348837 RepID=V6LD91_9EUKA|nr:hypothetical protein SS50377_21430 [Spironucleus salmonicida]|eukprot:EST42447.1 Hypothetical protein SS50377_18014 [Spironucleus salmonicida]
MRSKILKINLRDFTIQQHQFQQCQRRIQYLNIQLILEDPALQVLLYLSNCGKCKKQVSLQLALVHVLTELTQIASAINAKFDMSRSKINASNVTIPTRRVKLKQNYKCIQVIIKQQNVNQPRRPFCLKILTKEKIEYFVLQLTMMLEMKQLLNMLK